MPQPTRKRRRSSWNLPLGRVAGIDIRVNITFVVLLAWIVIGQLAAGHGVRAAAVGVALIVCVFSVIVLHELAHALVARHYGVVTRDITLLPIGGVSSLERIPDKPRQELAIALAGPAVNIVVAALLFGVLVLARGGLAGTGPASAVGSFVGTLAWVNLGLAMFNLLPAFPMDGGRVLRAALALRMRYDRATAVAARLGQAVAVLFGIFGLFYNPFLVLIALFVWIGAGHESALVQLRTTLAGVPVERAMITQFSTLSPTDPIARAVELTMSGFQSEFPIVEDGHVVGVVGHDEIVRALNTIGAHAPVERVMRRTFDVVASDTPVEAALPKVTAAGEHAVLVTRGDAVVGMLTSESIAQRMLVEGARHGQPA